MIPRVATGYVTLVFLFVFCQVIGAMCALPNLSVAEESAILAEEGMACPMDWATMCPPLLTSSHERKNTNSMVMNVDQETILPSLADMLAASSAPTLWSGSSVLSIVPISIGSSSVLRI